MTEIEDLWEMIDGRATFQVASEDNREQDARAPFLAEDIHAPAALPSFDHSAMDGYAFADLEFGWYPISRTIAAGQSPTDFLPNGQAARVLTGAPVPMGTLFVAKQEDCEVKEQRVRLRNGVIVVQGENIRKRGALITENEVVLHRGQRVHPGTLALLAVLGISEIPLMRRLTALHLATGDELIFPGKPLAPGKIYDANGPMVQALLEAHHVTCRRQHLADEVDALNSVLSECRENLLLISGGSGPGDRDHTQKSLESAGFAIHTRRINSRPGKPLIFASRGNQLAFGLPGNPLSHWVCFHAFVARTIARMYEQPPPPLVPVEIERPIPDVGDGRRTWTPARVSWQSGRVKAAPFLWAHSGDLRSLAEANALLLEGQYAMLTTPFF